MGLLQKAVETYDCFAHIAGTEIENQVMLAPIAHTTVNAELEITLNYNGSFLIARAVDKTEPAIVIPVTENSMGRTSTQIAPHPLTDQLCYLAPYNKKKNQAYIQQLKEWTESEFSHPKLKPILAYIESGTILQDLSREGLVSFVKGVPANEKLRVRWVLSGLGENSGPCWTDTELLHCFERFYENQRQHGLQAICMVSGLVEVPAVQHPKGIIPINGNAKLISANDTSGFTYRGRFCNDSQAATVSYTASQKAHNALRWIAANQGVSVVYGGRTFLCWNPQGIELPRVTGAMRRKSASEEKALRPSDYRRRLLDALNSWKKD